MFNPHLYEKLVQAHTQELLQEAEQQRLVNQVRQQHPQLVQKMVGWFMALPIFGRKMQYTKRPVTGQL